MVKFHEADHTHPYPFPTVTLAYFLRYPNPYASHVISTDVIDRHYDPSTSTLYTSRLHLKQSKLPSAIITLLPRSWLNVGPDGKTSQSFILERSVVDVRTGVMVTESRNLDYRGILEVVERQVYRRPRVDLRAWWENTIAQRGAKGYALKLPMAMERIRTPAGASTDEETATDVHTKVELLSRLGESRKRLWARAKTAEAAPSDADEDEPAPRKVGFFASLRENTIQRSIEAVGLRRTERAVPNSQKGMNAVLERLRTGGLIGVLEGMRRDRELAYAGLPTVRGAHGDEDTSTEII